MRFVLSLAAVLACLPVASPAQDLLGRKVGTESDGRPISVRAVTVHALGSLSRAAHVPIGFESLPAAPPNGRSEVVVTGLTVREALDSIVALDTRYEWRLMEDVIVIRPSGAWEQPENPLHAAEPAVRLGPTSARKAFAVVVTLLGTRQDVFSFSDTTPLVLDTAAGSILDLLNAIVRSHGELVWYFHHAAPGEPGAALFPYTVGLMSGPHGSGRGVPGRAAAMVGTVEALPAAEEEQPSPLDRVIPAKAANPLIVTGMGPHDLWGLSTAVQVPMGIEVDSRTAAPQVVYQLQATGRTLRSVLNDLVALDPRYAWRELDGVIVVRPASAWSDPHDPLFSIVPDVQLDERPMTEVVNAVLSALGGQGSTTFPDSKRISVSALQPTALDLLNAVAKAHGLLVWAYEHADPNEAAGTGLHHRLTLYIAGGSGTGMSVR